MLMQISDQLSEKITNLHTSSDLSLKSCTLTYDKENHLATIRGT